MGRRGIRFRPATIRLTEPQTPMDRLWSVNMFLLVIVFTIAVSALLVLSRPLVNHYRFEKANCSVEEVRPRGKQNCTCGFSCQGTMPCSQIFVKYAVNLPGSKHHGQVRRRQMLHEDEITLKRYPLCSIYTTSGCDRNETTNQMNVYRELKNYDAIAENSTGVTIEEIENSTQPAELFRRKKMSGSRTSRRGSSSTAFTCYYLPGAEAYGYAIRHHNPPLDKCILLLATSWSIAAFDLLLQLAISLKMGMCRKSRNPQPML